MRGLSRLAAAVATVGLVGALAGAQREPYLVGVALIGYAGVLLLAALTLRR